MVDKTTTKKSEYRVIHSNPLLDKIRASAAGRVIVLKHVPYGFMEKEMFQYFKQFGQIKRIRIPRSKKGNFKEKAYVYFVDKEVAHVAAETMDNYLMFERRIRCSVLTENIPQTILVGPRLITGHPLRNRPLIEAAKRSMMSKTDEEEEQRKKAMISSLRKMMRKVRGAGFDYDFDYAAKA